MAMIYAPANPRIRERVLGFGQAGTGKSNLAITWMRRMPPTSHIHIWDTDDAYEFLVYEDSERNARLIERENFTIYKPDFTDWTQQLACAVEILDRVQPGDLAVFDVMTTAWDAMPDWYTNMIFEKGVDDYRVEMRRALETDREQAREAKKGGDKNAKEKRTQPLFDQFRDYGVINPEYAKLHNVILKINQTAHVYMTAEAAQINNENDPRATRELYRAVGERPKGNRRLPHFGHTTLHLGYEARSGEYKMTTVKDRGSRKQRKLEDEVWGTDEEPGDFTKVYLGPVGGWKMVKVDA